MAGVDGPGRSLQAVASASVLGAAQVAGSAAAADGALEAGEQVTEGSSGAVHHAACSVPTTASAVACIIVSTSRPGGSAEAVASPAGLPSSSCADGGSSARGSLGVFGGGATLLCNLGRRSGEGLVSDDLATAHATRPAVAREGWAAAIGEVGAPLRLRPRVMGRGQVGEDSPSIERVEPWELSATAGEAVGKGLFGAPSACSSALGAGAPASDNSPPCAVASPVAGAKIGAAQSSSRLMS